MSNLFYFFKYLDAFNFQFFNVYCFSFILIHCLIQKILQEQSLFVFLVTGTFFVISFYLYSVLPASKLFEFVFGGASGGDGTSDDGGAAYLLDIYASIALLSLEALEIE